MQCLCTWKEISGFLFQCVVEIADQLFGCKYGTFLCDNERERRDPLRPVVGKTCSLWTDLLSQPSFELYVLVYEGALFFLLTRSYCMRLAESTQEEHDNVHILEHMRGTPCALHVTWKVIDTVPHLGFFKRETKPPRLLIFVAKRNEISESKYHFGNLHDVWFSIFCCCCFSSSCSKPGFQLMG